MHLEGDMTVVGNLTVDGHLSQLGIDYVTTIGPESQSQEQIVHYCDNVKYETVVVKEEYQRLQERLAVDGTAHCIKNNVSISAAKQTPQTTIITTKKYYDGKVYYVFFVFIERVH